MAVGWVGEGRDRLKLSQGDDVDENVPLQKGAPKRSWRRDLESTKGFVLEADLQAGSGVGGGGYSFCPLPMPMSEALSSSFIL